MESGSKHVAWADGPRAALRDLCGGFSRLDGESLAGSGEVVAGGDVPTPFDELLVHEEHMTQRLREYHGAAIALEVLEDRVTEDLYRRMILLRAGPEVVELGIVRIHLMDVGDAVKREILEKRMPLGDILTSHDVLRRIEPLWFLKFGAGGPIHGLFGRDVGEALYGRLGVIHYHGEPAIELLEVVSG